MSFRLGILVTHPIQYYSPWFRHLAEIFNIEVFYAHRQDSRAQSEAGFEFEFEWDTPLLEGYSYRWLANASRNPGVNSFWGCDTPEIHDIIRNEGFDAFLVFGWYYKSALQAMTSCWENRLPILVRGDSQLMTPRSLSRRILKWLPYRYFLPKLDAHLYVGKRNKEYLQYYGVPDEKLFFVPHFVDNDIFNKAVTNSVVEDMRPKIRKSLGIPLDGFVYIFAGKFITKKRPDDFVKACIQIMDSKDGGNIYSMLIGDGPMRSSLQSQASRKSDRIFFPGFRNQSEIPNFYCSSDAIVLPSNAGETWGLVINEAMASNLPAVVSDAVGCGPDLIDEGVTGFTYPLGDIETLCDRMIKLKKIFEIRPELNFKAINQKVGIYSMENATVGLEKALFSVLS
jgi:glycosyltransferase involved in cell wall biosynthesis